MAGKLTDQYIQVVRKTNGEITYGGDQGFFAGAAAGSEDDRKQRLGCGITALSDMFLYLAGQRADYGIRENEGLVNRKLSEEEYKSYYNRIYDFTGGIPAGTKNGLSGIRLQRVFNRMCRRQNWKLRAKWGFSGRKMYDRICRMQQNNFPVIMCIPVMLLKKDRGKGAIFYKKTSSGYQKAAVVSAHYVTVTGIIREEEQTYLVISSWGIKYYVNWEEYNQFIHEHFLGTILGNILYIS